MVMLAKAGREAAEAGESSGTSKSEPKDDSKDVGDDSDIPLKKVRSVLPNCKLSLMSCEQDGTPDMRYKAAKEAVADE